MPDQDNILYFNQDLFKLFTSEMYYLTSKLFYK